MIRHALFTAAASIAIALPAAAQTAPEASALSLSWVRGEGAEGCIDRRALMHAVRARLGRDPFADEAERGIEGEITRQGEKFVATLRVRAENGLELGQRRLEGPGEDCSALTLAVVLAVALTIDPDAAWDSGTARPLLSPSTMPAQPTAAPATPVPPVPAAAPRTGCPTSAPARVVEKAAPCERLGNAPSVGLSLRGLIAGGVLPGAAPGIELIGSLRWPHVHARAGYSWFPEERTSDERFSFGLSLIELGACWQPLDRGRWALSACATLGVGAMHAVVRELTPLDPGDRVFAAASLGPELSVGLAAGIRAELGAMAFVPLVRPEFVQRGVAEPVFESRVVGVLGLAGLAFQTR